MADDGKTDKILLAAPPRSSFFPCPRNPERARTKMADTAAFFAKKKKKGKKKAFNANLVDIAAVTSSTHV